MNFSLNLQTALALIGALIVLVVYALSQWQGYRARRRRRPAATTAAIHPLRDSPTLQPQSAQAHSPANAPVFTQSPSAARPHMPSAETAPPAADFTPAARPPYAPFAESTSAAAARPPTAEAAAETAADSAAAAVPTSSNSAPQFVAAMGFERLSQIDYWVKITGERDLGRESALAIYRDSALNLTKPHSIYGLRAPDQVWCNLENEHEGTRFADVVLTIQLADRRGAITESEMTRFSSLVLRLSEGTGRNFHFMASVEDALAQARMLAKFIKYFDASIVLTVRPAVDGGEFHGADIERCATQVGLERDNKKQYSRFKVRQKTQVALYSLANASEAGGFEFEDMHPFRAPAVIFYTRPALNRSPSAMFAEMADTAKAFAERIHGIVTADHAELTQSQVEATRVAVDATAAEMTRYGIPPGGEEAIRIF